MAELSAATVKTDPEAGVLSVERLMKRELIYRWFASLFASELSSQLLEHYCHEDGRAFLAELAKEEALTPVTNWIAEMLSDHEDLSGLVMDLAGSFSQLFLGAGGRYAAPPYQSAHQGDNARLFKEPVSEMNAILRQLDMSLPEDFREPADHLSVQLNVMAQLATSGTVADQLDFLEAHLVKWVPAFAKACQVNDRKGFYAVAAIALDGWLTAEKSQLQICNQQSLTETTEG